MYVSSGKKRGRVSENGTGEQKTHSNGKERSVGMVDKSSCALVAKQTLIVCPSAVLSTWKNQLREHTQEGALKLYEYYGARSHRTEDVEAPKKYEIVLTTYGTIASEYGNRYRQCPLMKIEWWRVILDEAHVIKNAQANQSIAVTELTARRRWAVTGAPIQNGSLDLSALMAFLRLDPLSTKSYCETLLHRPIAQPDGDGKGFSLLQILMATISLRRTKDEVKVGLPSKTVDTVRFQLSREECEIYDRMEAQPKHVVGNLIASGKINSSYSPVLCIVLRLRQLCNDSALCSLLPSDNIGDASQRPELLKKMLNLLRPCEDFECGICRAPPTHNAVISIRTHIFCKICTSRSRRDADLCRQPPSWSDLFSPPPESFDHENPENTPRTNPSKVSTLIELLKESRAAKSTSNSVVFSLFDKTLVLLEEPLKEASFKKMRMDASTETKRRNKKES